MGFVQLHYPLFPLVYSLFPLSYLIKYWKKEQINKIISTDSTQIQKLLRIYWISSNNERRIRHI